LNDTHRAALAEIIESGPMPAVHGVVRWRLIDLCQWIFEEFRLTIAKQTLSRELRAMGYASSPLARVTMDVRYRFVRRKRAFANLVLVADSGRFAITW
jgi:hypothetical protein